MNHASSILALTDEIESLISDGRWAEAGELEGRRRELLVEYVEAEGHGAPHLRDLHQRSLHSMEHIQRLKSSLAGDASRLIGNSRAVEAYLDNSGTPSLNERR